MDDILKIALCHLTSILINSDDILKVVFCHLASILININNKTDNFIKGKLVLSN